MKNTISITIEVNDKSVTEGMMIDEFHVLERYSLSDPLDLLSQKTLAKFKRLYPDIKVSVKE